mmetsp:Transcript_66953/g.174206  ORF Transcript_66953/g.174206 Transcript_66953/m.174206 type:complete len:315 (+) Transcript_66953:330-1274(+)
MCGDCCICIMGAMLEVPRTTADPAVCVPASCTCAAWTGAAIGWGGAATKEAPGRPATRIAAWTGVTNEPAALRMPKGPDWGGEPCRRAKDPFVCNPPILQPSTEVLALDRTSGLRLRMAAAGEVHRTLPRPLIRWPCPAMWLLVADIVPRGGATIGTLFAEPVWDDLTGSGPRGDFVSRQGAGDTLRSLSTFAKSLRHFDVHWPASDDCIRGMDCTMRGVPGSLPSWAAAGPKAPPTSQNVTIACAQLLPSAGVAPVAASTVANWEPPAASAPALRSCRSVRSMSPTSFSAMRSPRTSSILASNAELCSDKRWS